MAKHELHDRAIEMRKQGASYTEIKTTLGVSKSTLSGWLHAYPLSPRCLKQLRTNNERQIERTRETKAKKKNARLSAVYTKASKQIHQLSDRDLFISGLFLYWAEGTKASPGTIQLTNTDPAMIQFFIAWLETQGILRTQLKVYLHLYADMDIQKTTMAWSTALRIPLSAFRKPYIKSSFHNKRRNYKGRFGYGTCNVILHNRDLYEFMMMGMKRIREHYGGDGFPII